MQSITNRIIEYESGQLDFDDFLQLFCDLINLGLINQLQGSYQRTARDIIQGNLIIFQDGKWIINNVQ